MRLRHPDGTTVHLAYCSNVHPAEELDGILEQIDTYAAAVRRRLGWPVLGLGLWLADGVALQLDGDERLLERLRRGLDAAGCEVVTLNAFPYAGFHDVVVKHAVYRPDWTTPERREHTLRLARILTRLMPDDLSDGGGPGSPPLGTISTLPLGWRTGWDEQDTAAALAALDGLAADLADLEATTGRRIAIAVEPEPGCRVETTAQLADVLGGHDPDHLGACIDLCHLAVQFEEGPRAIADLVGAGVAVHKCQVSSALRIAAPDDPEGLAAARPFAEPRFLHQTRQRTPAGDVVGVDDLPEALDVGLDGVGEWRVHVHLPVHHDGPETTRPELLSALEALVGGPRCLVRHLEVETYTWSVLPPGRRPDEAADPVAGLVEGIAAELSWTADALVQLGLEPLTPRGSSTA